MKRTILASLLALIGGSGVGAQTPVEYRFDEVRRTVTVMHGEKELRAAKGQQAESGDKVATGWFSYALIGSDRHRARFEIFSATTVTLAAGTPGVILTLERGRIRAAFDKIVGSEPRTVQTPGALLAVRGTKFDVEVDRDGETTLDVFEGIVEVQSSLRQQPPLMVRAGEESSFGPRRPPDVRPMPEHRRNNGPDANRNKNNPDPNRPGDRRGEPGARPPGEGGHGQPAGPPSGQPSGNPPPPPPPPHKPPVE
jgi:hypothetical protein